MTANCASDLLSPAAVRGDDIAGCAFGFDRFWQTDAQLEDRRRASTIVPQAAPLGAGNGS